MSVVTLGELAGYNEFGARTIRRERKGEKKKEWEKIRKKCEDRAEKSKGESYFILFQMIFSISTELEW